MKDHIIGEDYELWGIITDGTLAIIKNNIEGVDKPKTRAHYTSEEFKMWPKWWINKKPNIKYYMCG